MQHSASLLPSYPRGMISARKPRHRPTPLTGGLDPRPNARRRRGAEQMTMRGDGAMRRHSGVGRRRRGRASSERSASDEDTAAAEGGARLEARGRHLRMRLCNFTPLGEGGVGVSVEEDEEAGWEQQAGGHGGTIRAVGEGRLLEKAVGGREKEFYERAFAGVGWPTRFMPRYHPVEGEEGKIRIENLVYGMDYPCVLDFKLGTSSVEANESKFLKKARMKSLDILTGSSSAGVRLEGMSMHRVLENARVKATKSQSHFISASAGVTLQDVITFFLTDESGVRDDVALRFQTHMEALLYHFENKNDSTLFIGSSILLVYNNDNQMPHMRWARALAGAAGTSPDTLTPLTRRTKVDVRMIDFAHTGPLPPGQTRDHGYITGLRSILGALKAIRATRTAPIFSMRSAVSDVMENERHPSAPAPAPAPAPVPAATRPAQGRRIQLGARIMGRGEVAHNFQTLFEHLPMVSHPGGSADKHDAGGAGVAGFGTARLSHGRRSQLGARILGRVDSSHSFHSLPDDLSTGGHPGGSADKQETNGAGMTGFGSRRGFGRG